MELHYIVLLVWATAMSLELTVFLIINHNENDFVSCRFFLGHYDKYFGHLYRVTCFSYRCSSVGHITSSHVRIICNANYTWEFNHLCYVLVLSLLVVRYQLEAMENANVKSMNSLSSKLKNWGRNHQKTTSRRCFLRVYASNLWMVDVTEWPWVRRQPWHLRIAQEALQDRWIVLDNKQDLKDVLWSISWLSKLYSAFW